MHNTNLLKHFIKLSMNESPANTSAQILDQDIIDSESNTCSKACDCDSCETRQYELDEFSAAGAGGMAGYTAPMSVQKK